MLLSYWDCNYAECDDYEDDGSTLYIYNCTHPLNKDKYCNLNNKWCNAKDNCTLLDAEIYSCP